jgi:uroporphyrinogen decarboxylase
MGDYIIPLANPKPDCERFVRVLMGQEQSARPPLVEYIIDPAVMKPILTGMMGRQWVDPAGDRESYAAYLDNFIAFWHAMGYDFVRLEIALPFTSHGTVTDDTAPGVEGKRGWRDSKHGAITTWEDFETYPWPSLEKMDFFPLEYVTSHLPEGMGFITCHGGGIYEHLSAIMSYEGLSFALVDQPDLVAAVCSRVGELMEGYYRHILELDNLSVVFPGDDMGFRHATLISPRELEARTLPWHKRFCAMTHEKGLPYFLHSCGCLEEIMPFLIDEVGIDGKHSFEDAIIPVAEMQRRYGDRIAILGGVDVDVLTRATPEDLRRYVRGILDECAPRGRYAIGAGNSVPSYIQVENYLTMIDEALQYPG